MATIGKDCEIILDGTGYWIDPETYHMARPRVRRADLTKTPATAAAGYGAGVPERYLDQGPGKRQWTIAVQCFQAMRDYTGQEVALTGQQYHDALHTSYEKVATTLSYTDPMGHAWTVYFDHLEETVSYVRAQADNLLLQYHATIILVEA